MKVGDKVVCKNDDFSNNIDLFIKVFDQLPMKGKEYTVRRREMWDGKFRILLEEIKNPPFQEGPLKGIEPGFDSNRFEKIVKETIEVSEKESAKI